jgi:hypothetical protein
MFIVAREVQSCHEQLAGWRLASQLAASDVGGYWSSIGNN